MALEEGFCVQCMQIGAFDGESATDALMDQYLQGNGSENDFSENPSSKEKV